MHGEFPDAVLPLDSDAGAALLQEFERDPRSPDRSPVRRLINKGVPGSAMDPLRIAITRAAEPLARRRIAAALESASPLRLHLGSGFEYKPGWTNIDRLPVKVDIPWDLRRGIPFPDGTADAIFHEHLQEHIAMRHGYALAVEALRVLRPGGIYRVGVPDAGEVVQSYAGGWSDGWARSAPTGMIAIQQLFYENGHRAMYDGQTMRLLLETAGFADVQRTEFGAGRLRPSADTEDRRSGTLYMEGIKP